MWALAAKVTHFCSILLSVIALHSIIGGSIGGVAALIIISSFIIIVLVYYCCKCLKKGKQSKSNNLRMFIQNIVLIVPRCDIYTWLNILCISALFNYSSSYALPNCR